MHMTPKMVIPPINWSGWHPHASEDILKAVAKDRVWVDDIGCVSYPDVNLLFQKGLVSGFVIKHQCTLACLGLCELALAAKLFDYLDLNDDFCECVAHLHKVPDSIPFSFYELDLLPRGVSSLILTDQSVSKEYRRSYAYRLLDFKEALSLQDSEDFFSLARYARNVMRDDTLTRKCYETFLAFAEDCRGDGTRRGATTYVECAIMARLCGVDDTQEHLDEAEHNARYPTCMNGLADYYILYEYDFPAAGYFLSEGMHGFEDVDDYIETALRLIVYKNAYERAEEMMIEALDILDGRDLFWYQQLAKAYMDFFGVMNNRLNLILKEIGAQKKKQGVSDSGKENKSDNMFLFDDEY